MKNICIVLSTMYENKKHHFFIAEVQQDLNVVHETLSDHVFLEISIPLQAGTLSIRKRIDSALQSIDIDENSDCHIVLNTHGTPGKSDLKHESVIYLVEQLSLMQATIVQISALQCDGMCMFSGKRSLFNPYSMDIPGAEEKNIYREAALFQLQKKLNRLKSDKAQAFKIFGFDRSYNPFVNQEDVKTILMGKGSHALDVTINSFQFGADELNKSKEKILLLMEFHHLKRTEYQELGNNLAKLQKYMKQHLILALKNHQEIGPDSPLWCLCLALTDYAQKHSPNTVCIDPHSMENIYKSWLKNYKLYSHTRIQVFLHFVTVSLQQVARETKSSVPCSFKV